MATSNWDPQQRGTNPAWYGVNSNAPTGGGASGSQWWNYQMPAQTPAPVDPWKDAGKQYGQSGRSSFEAYGGYLNPYARQDIESFFGNDWPMARDWAHNFLSNITSQGGIDSLASQFQTGAMGTANAEAGRNTTMAQLMGLSPNTAAGNNLAATNRATDATNAYRTSLMTGDVQSKVVPMLVQLLGSNPALQTQMQLAQLITGLPVKKRGGLSLGSILGAGSQIAGIIGGFGGFGGGGGPGTQGGGINPIGNQYA